MSTYTVTLPRKRSLGRPSAPRSSRSCLPLGVVQLGAVAAFVGTRTGSAARRRCGGGRCGAGGGGDRARMPPPAATFFVRDAARTLLRAEIIVCLVTLIGFGQFAWLAVLPVIGLTRVALWVDERRHPSSI